MVDLDVYRHRIGTFTSKLTSNKCQDVKVSYHLSREQRSHVKTMFTVLTVGLCLVLLGCQLEEQEAGEWLSSSGTTCHKILCFIRSVCEQYLHGELKGIMLDNVIKTLKFRDYFLLFSYILTKEPKYQIHTGSTNYTPEVQIHVDNTSYTPEVQIHVDNTSYTPEVQIHVDNTSYTPEVQIHVDNTSYTPEVQIHVDYTNYTPEVQIHVDYTSYTPEVQIHVDNTSYTPEVQIHVDNTSYTPEPVDVRLIVERHGTASYLLGNGGQHAYNGNPAKRSRDSDTPSTSMDEEIKHLHFTMISELNCNLSSSMKTEWKTFTGVLEMYLDPTDIEGVTTMFEVSKILIKKGCIKYGKYDKLKILFSTIKNHTCCDIVDKCSRKMEEVETQHHRTQPGTCTMPAKLNVVADNQGEVSLLENALLKMMRSGIEQAIELPLKEKNKELSTLRKESGLFYQLLEKFKRKEFPLTAAHHKSIILSFHVAGTKALNELWDMYKSGKLLNMLKEALITDFQRERCKVDNINLEVYMSEEDYRNCLKALDSEKSEGDVSGREMDISGVETVTSGMDDLSLAPDYMTKFSNKTPKEKCEDDVKGQETDTSGYEKVTSQVADVSFSPDYTTESLKKNLGRGKAFDWLREADLQRVEKKIAKSSTETGKNPTDAMALVVKSWKEDDKLCYESKRVKAVKEKICNDSYVCVIGVPGSGKSTAIRHAALHLQKTSQYTIYPLKTPEEFDKYLDENKTQVFVIDDTVGEHFVDKEKLGLWDSCNDRIKSCLEVSKNTKFLTSLRLQLYLDETLKGKTYIFNDPDKKVNFSDKDFKLSLDDMENMLHHYLKVRNVGNSKALIEDICGERWWREGWDDEGWAAKSADYFPLLCKVFSENESVRENPEKFFTAPFPALTDIFRQIKSKNKHQFCGLLLCAFMELKREYLSPHYPHDKPKIFTSLIESQNLDPKKDLDDIKKALHSLDGVYISHVANKYDFSHSTFRDITTFLYEDKYVIFQHAARDFIRSRVRLFSKLSEDDDYVLVFHGEDCIELLVNRMIHELKCQTWWGDWFIVENRYIDDERVVNALCTKLFNSQDITRGRVLVSCMWVLWGYLFVNQGLNFQDKGTWCLFALWTYCLRHLLVSRDITQDRVDELFDRCMEAVWEYSRDHRDNRDEMSWPCYKLLVRLIPRVDCTRQMWRTYPVLLCVGTGSLSLTKLVVQQNSAVINAVDVRYRSVLHRALWCVNNVDMTRYLLSLPNLTRLNHRDENNRSPYWYVVHRQIANRQEMMDIYKQAGAIALGD